MADLTEKLKKLKKDLDSNAAGKTNRVEIEPLKVNRARHFKTDASTLRAAIEANPTHPVALAFTKGVRGLPDNKVVTVEHVDLEALLDDKNVELNEEEIEIDGDRHIAQVKRLGTKRTKKDKEADADPQGPDFATSLSPSSTATSTASSAGTVSSPNTPPEEKPKKR